MTRSLRRLLLVGMTLVVASSLLAIGPARAADRTFALVVNDVEGWGASWDSLTNPGPALAVEPGDNVTLLLNATDGSANHRWFIDYDNDRNEDADEPSSPNFSGPTQVSWNFTADRNGTFLYRDRFHTNLTGTIEIGVAGRPADNSLLLVAILVAAVAGVLVLFVLRDRLSKKK